MKARSVRPAPTLLGGIAAGIVAGVLALSGCEETSVTVLAVSSVEVTPSQVELVQGAERILSATPRDAEGRPLVGRTVSWVSDDPAIAQVDAEGRLRGLEPGSTRVRATVGGVTGQGDVDVLPGPAIQLSASAVEMEATAGSDEPHEAVLEVTNAGAGALTGLGLQVEDLDGEGTGWLAAELSSSSAPTTLTLSASAADLSPGTRRAGVRLSSPVAVNSPVELEVTLDVAEPPPHLAVEPTAISLSARSGAVAPATQEVEITNEGGGALDAIQATVRNYTGGPTGWLSVVLEATRAPTTATLVASAQSLPAGQYAATVRFSSPVTANDYVDVRVTFTVGGN